MNKAKQILNRETAVFAANELSGLFPKTEKETEYSLGFTRWLKTTAAQRKALLIIHNFSSQECIQALNF